jgi:hypothetical protein
MEHQKVISVKNLPTRAPTTVTVLAALVLDRLKAPGWVAGAVWTVIAILWIATVVAWLREDYVELKELQKERNMSCPK